ncbi:bifunctional demethylmenaquinone methyltransferase/2-methoxy-6-polyprenyl-1,4-benzoquinol methylase UbiE [Phaeovibrio sulfidiphilus]
MTPETGSDHEESREHREHRESREHRETIRAMFDRIARRYDLMNDLMSGGVHRWWKRRLVALAGTPAHPGAKALDLAGGTGDVARLLEARGWDVSVCDPSDGMMDVGRARTRATSRITWVSGVAEELPFPDASVDLVTISFGLRNTTDREAALREAVRVLRPGGRFLCLEFSTPHPLVRGLYDLYSATVIPELARLFSRDPEAYRYLTRSIRVFPDQEGLRLMMLKAGFAEVQVRNLFFGIAALHSGLRPVPGLTKDPVS